MVVKSNVPNLDSLDVDEHWAIWQRTNSVRPIAYARELFPGKPKGYTRIAKDLGCYASNKATAMSCRLRGDIQTALTYEGICDRIYDRLPDWSRW